LISSGDFPSKFKRPEDSPGFLLWRVTNSWQRRIRHKLKELELTHVQFVLLTATEWLNNAELSTTQANVARFAHTDVMMTSQVIRTLERKGLVTVEADFADTRAHLLKVTPAGHRLVKRALDLVEDADERFFGPLAGDTGRFTEMLRVLIESEKQP
jgi:DNA-binding MarR family transcriptional regulator